LIVKRINKIFL